MTEREALRKAFASNPKRAQELMELFMAGKLKAEEPDPDEEMQVVSVRWPGCFDGCTKEKCEACGHDVAVAPSTREMLRNNRAGVKYFCVDCMAMQAH